MSAIAASFPNFPQSLVRQISREELAHRSCLNIVDFIKALELDYVISWEQMQHIRIMVDPTIREVLLIRSRGGSKTFDALLIGVYYAYLGYKVVFWAAAASMTEQPIEYLDELVSQCFLEFCIKEKLKSVVRFDTGGWIKIKNLTEKQARSPRCDLEIYDEEAQADEAAYNATSPVLSVSHIKKIIHLSTPVKGSFFEENYKRMKKDGLPVLVLRWDQCAHMNQDRLFMEKELKTKPRWWVRQEYFCSFEAPEGKVFENVVFGQYDLSQLAKDYSQTHVCYGVDWNPAAGHYINGNRWNDDYTANYAMFEKNLGTSILDVINAVFELLRKDEHSLCEIEDGGTNSGYCDIFFALAYKMAKEDPKLKSIMRRISRRSWDSQGINKNNSITNLIPCVIYCDELLCPKLGYWLSKASWVTVGGQSKLDKDGDQHPLDSYLHGTWIGDRGVKHCA